MKKILSAFLGVLLVAQAAFGANTPNKGYNNQTTGTNTGTWGIVLNQNFSTIDSNLGGTLTLGVDGNTNVTLSSAQAQSLIYNFTGVLTGNINVIFPAAGGLYFINNKTTGNFTLTVQAGSSVSGFLVPQGTQAPVYVDNSTSPPTIGGAAGTQYVFTAGSVAGTPNALTIPTTLPSNFTLSNGTFLTFTPAAFNTGSTTLQTPDGNIKTIQKVGATGLVNLQPDDLTPGVPIISQYNGSVWVALNLLYYGTPVQQSSSFTLGFSGLYVPYVSTTPISVTLDSTADYGPIFYTYFLANGGAITLIPNGTDNINGANASFTIPTGSSGKLFNDGNGNWWVYFVNAPINSPTFTGTVTAPAITTSGNIGVGGNVNITGTLSVTGLSSLGTATGNTPSIGDTSTKLATTAFVNQASSLGGNGYQKFPNGFIMEWGTTGAAGGNLTVTTSFPLVFPTGVFAINITGTANAGGTAASVTSKSTSQFTITNGSLGNSFYYIAVGD